MRKYSFESVFTVLGAMETAGLLAERAAGTVGN